MAQLEIKKMKQGMSYSCKEKTIILNVFKYFRMQFPEKCVTEIVRRTAKATGCSEKSVFQFRKEEASAEGFREPSRTKVRKNININSRAVKYDSGVRQAIRYIVYDLKCRGVIPSLNTILKQVNADSTLPNFSLMTLRRLLFDMGFCYEKNGNKSILVDKADPSLNPPIQKKPPPSENPKPQQLLPPQPNHQDHQQVQYQQMAPPPHEQRPMQMPPTHNMYGDIGRRDCIPPSHHNMPMHHHPVPHPHAPPPNNMDMHIKMEMTHWMHHPIVQHS